MKRFQFSFVTCTIRSKYFTTQKRKEKYQNRSGDFITVWFWSCNYIKIGFVWRCSVWRLDLTRERLLLIRLHVRLTLLSFCKPTSMQRVRAFWCTLVVTAIIYDYYLFMKKKINSCFFFFFLLLLLYFLVTFNCLTPNRTELQILWVLTEKTHLTHIFFPLIRWKVVKLQFKGWIIIKWYWLIPVRKSYFHFVYQRLKVLITR